MPDNKYVFLIKKWMYWDNEHQTQEVVGIYLDFDLAQKAVKNKERETSVSCSNYTIVPVSTDILFNEPL